MEEREDVKNGSARGIKLNVDTSGKASAQPGERKNTFGPNLVEMTRETSSKIEIPHRDEGARKRNT